MLICKCDAHPYPHLAGFNECGFVQPAHSLRPHKWDLYCTYCGGVADYPEDGSGAVGCCSERMDTTEGLLYEVDDLDTAIMDFFADALGDDYEDIILEAICVMLSAKADESDEAR